MTMRDNRIGRSTADITNRNWSVDVSSATVEPIRGVTAPETVRASGPLWTLPSGVADSVDELDKSAHLELEAVFTPGQAKYTLRHLAVTAPGESEVTGTLLRRIAPLSVMRWVLPRTFEMDFNVFSPHVANFVTPEWYGAHANAEGEQTASVKDAATIYRLAEVVREPPAKAVAEALGLQARTATNWIMRAKKQGLLG